MARLKEYYKNQLREKIKQKFNLKNINEVPKLSKIVLNMGVGEAIADSKKINSASEDLMNITGQKPVVTNAKQSIAGFKLRKGLSIGCKVTLRKNRMYEFLDRLIYIALPRVRDFKGLSLKSFDDKGNYSIGIKEQIIFPEIDYDKIDKVRGMDISLVTSTQNIQHSFELLKGLNLPFTKGSFAKPDEAKTKLEKTSTNQPSKVSSELSADSLSVPVPNETKSNLEQSSVSNTTKTKNESKQTSVSESSEVELQQKQSTESKGV
ncbi:MAG: 50S ribosomal protein L5 [Rickettsiales bacterium]|nr:50S ribosomal protein L5 [Rickettsiales bacterium]|tara:strand:- start:2542 stop:3333 length:792 start_codon:yes stop_codon:yes gene_type:complete